MKRILLVSRNFPPLWGGMERLNLHLVGELCRHYDVRLIAPAGAADHVPDSVQVIQVPLQPLSRFLLTAAWRTMQQARTWKPDVILAGSGLTAPLALAAAWRCGARTIAYVHGLDLAVPHAVYRALWRPALRSLDNVIANSHATAQLARDIGIDPDRISIVHPGVSLTPPDTSAAARFRSNHQLGRGPILLSVGRLTMRKGLREFVSEVLPLIVTRHPDIRLVVIGDAPMNSLYAEVQSPESICAAANAAGVGEHLRLLGKRFGTELSDAYAAADLHVFPVRHIPNDPEGFGMVAVEAAAHGLATVAYATGGVVDAIAPGESGLLVPPGDPAAFARCANALLETPLSDAGIRGFASKFEWTHFGTKINSVIGRMS